MLDVPLCRDQIRKGAAGQATGMVHSACGQSCVQSPAPRQTNNNSWGKKVGSYSTFHFKDTFINEKGFKGTWCNEKYSCISPTWLLSRKSKYHFGMFFVYAGFSKALHGQARPQSPSRAFSIPITVLFVCVVLEMECKASHMLGQYSAVELHPQPLLLAFSIFSISTRPERVLIGEVTCP